MDPSKQGEEHAKTEKIVKERIETDGNIQYLLKSIRRLGCTKQIPFVLKHCDEYGDSPAHFVVDEEGPKVVICENRVGNRPAELKKYVTHELVHAYDFCRAEFSMENLSCEAMACTEIRAALLSGECSFSNELMAGNTGFVKQGKKCIIERATGSTQRHKNCEGAIGESAVYAVYDTCVHDRRPFGRMPI